jgi:EamA domain-containing membrane protein RarD
MPPERLVGFVLVWAALAVLAADALSSRRRTAPLVTAVDST